MNTTSKSHFARMCGVSPAAITLASKSGIIGVTDDGFVNLDHKKTKAYLKRKREKAAAKGVTVEPPPRKVRVLKAPKVPPLKKRDPPKQKNPPKAKKETGSKIIEFPGGQKPPAPPPPATQAPPPPPRKNRTRPEG